jgi:hypothetical protein
VAGVPTTLNPGLPMPLFDSHIPSLGTNINNMFQYDVTADGKRFVVVTAAADATSPPLTIEVNWTDGRR